jgi:translation elongation factor EF-1beta
MSRRCSRTASVFDGTAPSSLQRLANPTSSRHRALQSSTPREPNLIANPNPVTMFHAALDKIKAVVGAADESKHVGTAGGAPGDEHGKATKSPKSKKADFDVDEEKDDRSAHMLFEIYPTEEILRHSQLQLLEAQLKALHFQGASVTIDESKSEDLAFGVKVIVLRLSVERTPGKHSPSADDVETAVKGIQVGNHAAVSSVRFLAATKT